MRMSTVSCGYFRSCPYTKSPKSRVQTRSALVAYSVGLTGLILVKVLAPGFYARQNIRTPVKVAILTLIATQLIHEGRLDPDVVINKEVAEGRASL